MSSEDVRQRFLEFRERLYGRHDLAAVDEMVHPDFTSDSPLIAPGIAGYKAFARMLQTALPDLQALRHDVVVEGDRLMAMAQWQGTHRGLLLGAAPTGAVLRFATADLYRLRDGLLAEHRDVVDRLDASIALGLVRPAVRSPA
ncbi:ester cyclase [Inquilinus sp. CA228]|uniref:ester cyclase n=1 Tax=Inquilinus sp. CA228 TaxID=3455609 RepID=UPI003F8D0893